MSKRVFGLALCAMLSALLSRRCAAADQNSPVSSLPNR